MKKSKIIHKKRGVWKVWISEKRYLGIKLFKESFQCPYWIVCENTITRCTGSTPKSSESSQATKPSQSVQCKPENPCFSGIKLEAYCSTLHYLPLFLWIHPKQFEKPFSIGNSFGFCESLFLTPFLQTFLTKVWESLKLTVKPSAKTKVSSEWECSTLVITIRSGGDRNDRTGCAFKKAADANHAHFETWFALIFRDITIQKVCETVRAWFLHPCDSDST
jgi:hypothetical protein